ncbi:efflux RND transporter periplasmic adaptor subunit [Falsiroseomonas sp. HC035]|uniref:efflux RND transporter periplasmic adaptor subunit n=1 Tax=Falsiroseomonas sp. HC035 TaxID=3390999 RepID=UPI003D316815
MRRRTALLLAAPVLLAIAVILLRLQPMDVEIAPAETNIPVTIFGLGTVEAQTLSRIGFEVPGTLTDLAADHGDEVRAGTVLARLNSAGQEARVARAEAGLQSAQAVAERAEAQRERAEAVQAQRQSTARRRRDLAQRGAGSAEAAELAETDAVLAAADLAVNRADAAVARAAIADARANLLAERNTLARHSLLAPYDALVVSRQREPGTALSPGEVVFTLIPPDSLWALAHVDEGRAGDLAVGQPAQVTLRSRPGQPMAAEVVRIGLEADRVTEERRVYLRCRSCPSRPILGEQVEALIETGRLPRARLVPESAVHGFDGAGGTVWTVEHGRLAQRHLRFAARLVDARLAIVEGLPEGAEVATRPTASFRIGRAARALPAP